MPGRIVQSVRPSSSLNANRPHHAVGAAPNERVGSDDALAVDVVERERHAQALRPVEQRRRLDLGRRVAAGKRALEQLGPGAEPVVDDLLGALAFLVEMAPDDPAADEREQQQQTTTVA